MEKPHSLHSRYSKGLRYEYTYRAHGVGLTHYIKKPTFLRVLLPHVNIYIHPHKYSVLSSQSTKSTVSATVRLAPIDEFDCQFGKLFVICYRTRFRK